MFFKTFALSKTCNFFIMNTRKLNEAVRKSGLSTKELSVRSGLSMSAIDNALAGGKLLVDTLEALSSALGVSPTLFFDGCKGNTTTNNYYMNGDGSQVNGERSHHNSYSPDTVSSLKKENELLRKSLEDKEHIIRLMQDAAGKEVADE